MLLLRVGKETMHQYSELHITPILLMHHFRKQRCDSSLIANILCPNSLLSWWLLPSLLQDCFPVTGFLKSDTFGPSKTFFFSKSSSKRNNIIYSKCCGDIRATVSSTKVFQRWDSSPHDDDGRWPAGDLGSRAVSCQDDWPGQLSQLVLTSPKNVSVA